MKKILLILTLALTIAACSSKSGKRVATSVTLVSEAMPQEYYECIDAGLTKVECEFYHVSEANWSRETLAWYVDNYLMSTDELNSLARAGDIWSSFYDLNIVHLVDIILLIESCEIMTQLDWCNCMNIIADVPDWLYDDFNCVKQ